MEREGLLNSGQNARLLGGAFDLGFCRYSICIAPLPEPCLGVLGDPVLGLGLGLKASDVLLLAAWIGSDHMPLGADRRMWALDLAMLAVWAESPQIARAGQAPPQSN